MKLHEPPLDFLKFHRKFFSRSVELHEAICSRSLEVHDFQAAWFWRLVELNQERFKRFWAVLGGPWSLMENVFAG